MNKTWLLSAALAMVCGSAFAQEQRAVPGERTERQERYDLAHKIVSEWGPYVKGIYGEDVGPWAKRLTPTLQQADTAKLRAAARADTFEGMMNGLTGGKAPSAKALPGGIAPKALGDVAADLVFTPLPQCNLLDTRLADGAFTAGVFKHFKASGSSFASQGGSNTNCGIPANVRALQLGVTAVNPTAKGYFKLWAYGETQPAASSMSFGPSQNTRNDIVLRVSQGLAYDFTAASNVGGGHLLVTVVGYYAPPEATALETTSATNAAEIPASGNACVSHPACPSGYAKTGASCYGPGSSAERFLTETGPNCCYFRNASATPFTGTAVSQCARVPGR